MYRGMFLVFGLVTTSLLLPGLASAQLYQWRDANGRVVFSDLPPPPGIPPGNIIKSPKARSTPTPSAAPAPAGVTAGAAGATQATATASAPGAAAAAKAGGQKSVAEREADYKKRQADADEKSKKDSETAANESRREEQCRGMRQSMAALEGGQRIRRFNDKGEPYFVEDAERACDTEKMRRDMAAAKCA